MSGASLVIPDKTAEGLFRSHLALMRLDHSVKQMFILPGIAVAIMFSRPPISLGLAARSVIGVLAVTAVASSNYVLNEILDAPFDRLHPSKHTRPAACGAVHLPFGYAQWLTLAALGLLISGTVSRGLLISSLLLWVMGCIYNIPPVRTKEVPYLDVISEAINNPLRFCCGWYIVTSEVIPPVSLLIAYWMLGAYFMALKRFSEYRQIGPERAGWYRKSFRHYTEKSLLNSTIFYAASAMLFFGAFIMRYRLELVLTFPIVALLMATYFNLSFEPDSPVQNPEKLFREPRLMTLLTVCVILFVLLLFLNAPLVARMFPRSTGI
jgi:decaprenyl-phosphate phosphoribosyltransferase